MGAPTGFLRRAMAHLRTLGHGARLSGAELVQALDANDDPTGALQVLKYGAVEGLLVREQKGGSKGKWLYGLPEPRAPRYSIGWPPGYEHGSPYGGDL